MIGLFFFSFNGQQKSPCIFQYFVNREAFERTYQTKFDKARRSKAQERSKVNETL